jgi:putative DNA primase/helicase
MPAMTDNVHSIGDKFAKASDRATRSIQIRPDALHLIATEGENALIAAASPVYVRGGLVKPVIDVLPAAHGKRTKAARLVEVDTDCLIDHLSRAASWVRYNVRKKEWLPTDPPRNVAQTILSRDGEWSFRRLAGVITAPTLRPDGTILSEAGYDPDTQLLLMDPPKLPAIPENPTREDAVRSLGLLLGLLKEFPFANEPSRSVALSAMLTVVVRGALAAVPMHATTAPVAGSGKSYIIDLASALGVGDSAPVISAGKTDEETEKRLVSALLNGQSVISIDNVNGELGGDLLCQMVERPLVSVRPLGSSKLVKIENRASVFATGNNIHLVGDMTRRVIVCALDPQTERPELRKFNFDPFAMVMADRGKYIAAALTICRAYAVAGYPDQCRPLASFGDWSKVVRSALVWLGCADPVITMEAARAEDPDISDLKALLHSWHGAVGNARLSCAEIINRSRQSMFDNYSYPELRQALTDVAEDRRGDISARRLGKYLAAKKGRIVDGLRFTEVDDGHANVKAWSVAKV